MFLNIKTTCTKPNIRGVSTARCSRGHCRTAESKEEGDPETRLWAPSLFPQGSCVWPVCFLSFCGRLLDNMYLLLRQLGNHSVALVTVGLTRAHTVPSMWPHRRRFLRLHSQKKAVFLGSHWCVLPVERELVIACVSLCALAARSQMDGPSTYNFVKPRAGISVSLLCLWLHFNLFLLFSLPHQSAFSAYLSSLSHPMNQREEGTLPRQ